PMKIHESLLSGCLAGAFAQTISYPIDTVRKALQTAPPGKYSGMGQCAMDIVKTEGPLSLFQGISINLVKVVPFASLSFFMYDQCKGAFTQYNNLQAEKKKLE
ncbi:mitochondrial carrier protein, partial [Kipferlia bialata]